MLLGSGGCRWTCLPGSCATPWLLRCKQAANRCLRGLNLRKSDSTNCTLCVPQRRCWSRWRMLRGSLRAWSSSCTRGARRRTAARRPRRCWTPRPPPPTPSCWARSQRWAAPGAVYVSLHEMLARCSQAVLCGAVLVSLLSLHSRRTLTCLKGAHARKHVGALHSGKAHHKLSAMTCRRVPESSCRLMVVAVRAQEKPAGKQAESWAAELKSRELQTVDIGLAIGARPPASYGELLSCRRELLEWDRISSLAPPTVLLSSEYGVCYTHPPSTCCYQ